MKKAISVSLVLVMVLSLFCVPVFAAEVVASGECGAEGDNVTWTLDNKGTLTVSGNGKTGNYTSSTTPWSSIRATIKRRI